MKESDYPVHGAGLGLRRTLLGPLADQPPAQVGFYEVAPENWIGVGGRYGKQFRAFTERYPFVCHGLSLSIGAPSPLDETFLQRVKRFLDQHQIRAYTEHLSYCSDDGHLYDLMPIPFTEEAVSYVAARVRRVQDILEQRIALDKLLAGPGADLRYQVFNGWGATGEPRVLTWSLVPDGTDWSALNNEFRAGGLQLAGGQGQGNRVGLFQHGGFRHGFGLFTYAQRG